MVKTQIQLSEVQARALKALAEAQNKSTAELIRQAVEQFLRSTGEISPAERKRRAIATAGRFRSGLPDLSTEHNRHLAEAYQQ
jgi:predicted transcriptional regulator